jgi:hypothetical protein
LRNAGRAAYTPANDYSLRDLVFCASKPIIHGDITGKIVCALNSGFAAEQFRGLGK